MKKCIYYMITLIYLVLYSFGLFYSVLKTGKELGLNLLIFGIVLVGMVVIWGICQLVKKINFNWESMKAKVVSYFIAMILSFGVLVYKGVKVNASIVFLVGICVVVFLCLGIASFISDSFGGVFALILSSLLLYFMISPLKTLFSILSFRDLASFELATANTMNNVQYFEGVFERWQMILHVNLVFDLVAILALIAGFYAWKRSYPRMIFGMAAWNGIAIVRIFIGSQSLLALVSYLFTPIFAAIGLRSMLEDNSIEKVLSKYQQAFVHIKEDDEMEGEENRIEELHDQENTIESIKAVQETEVDRNSIDHNPMSEVIVDELEEHKEIDTQGTEEIASTKEEVAEVDELETEASLAEVEDNVAQEADDDDDDIMHIEIMHLYPPTESEQNQDHGGLTVIKKDISKNRQESAIIKRTENLEQSVVEISQQLKSLNEQMDILIKLNKQQQLQLSQQAYQSRARKGILKSKKSLKRDEPNVKKNAKIDANNTKKQKKIN